MNGCRKCPAFDKCTVYEYRGPKCAALRRTYSIESDPEIITMVELKPCPFCGGNAILAHDYTGLGMSYIRCECCGIESVHFIKSFEVASDDLAIKYWNKRNDDGKWKAVD